MKLKKNSFAILLTLLIITACNPFNEKNATETKQDVLVTQAEIIKSGDVLHYSGTIEERQKIPLTFPVIGQVEKVFVDEGEAVKKGQVLAQLNREVYKNSYEIALALQKQAEDAYNRLHPMYKNGNLPEIKMVEVETRLAQAKSATAIAFKQFTDCTLRSPIDGYVGKRIIEPGMTATPNITSINIITFNKVFALISIPENEISSLKLGQKAIIQVGAINNSSFTGTVEQMGVMADPLAHTYKIKIGIPNPQLKIKPGMICTASLVSANQVKSVRIPAHALRKDSNGETYIYTVKKGTVHLQYVTTGRLLHNGVEIVNGLSLQDSVVVSGHHKLVDKALIKVINR